MADEVVRGPAVHSKAEEARRALHAARRRRPSTPMAAVPDPAPAPVGPPPLVPEAHEAHEAPATEPQLRALVDENQALRAENAELRAALRRLRDQADRALDD